MTTDGGNKTILIITISILSAVIIGAGVFFSLRLKKVEGQKSKMKSHAHHSKGGGGGGGKRGGHPYGHQGHKNKAGKSNKKGNSSGASNKKGGHKKAAGDAKVRKRK